MFLRGLKHVFLCGLEFLLCGAAGYRIHIHQLTGMLAQVLIVDLLRSLPTLQRNSPLFRYPYALLSIKSCKK
jgi:hypothetical protein